MRRRAVALAVALALGAAERVQAQALLAGWHITATNTARAERYDARGDLAYSIYRELGSTAYDEFLVQGESRPTAYSHRRFVISGVVNDSPYRAQDRGVVPEQLLYQAESGEGRLPWRVQAGDYYAFTTPRTMQRQLKGASVELQPRGALPQSLVLFGGAQQSSWRHAQWSDDNALGASWLVDGGRFGKWNANLLRNERGPDPFFGPPGERRQTVASLAAESPLMPIGTWKLRAEGEVARLDADDEGTGDALFAQLSGVGDALSWRLRGERYDRDYRPFGATTSPDRRSLEAEATWKLPRGLTLVTRLQDFRDQAQSANPTDTAVATLNLSGTFGWGTGGSIEAVAEQAEDRDGNVDARTTRFTASLSKPFGRVVGQLNAFYQDRRDDVNADSSQRIAQLQVGAILPFNPLGLRGTIGPGVQYRRITGSGAAREWQPTLNMGLAGGPHRFSLNVGRLAQEPRSGAFPEVATVNAAVDYRYAWGQHEVGADAIAFERRPSPGERTEAWRVGVFWTWKFERPPATLARLAMAPSLRAAGVPAQLAISPALLARVVPGHELDAVEAALRASAGAPLREPGTLVYEARLLPEVEQRQRLVVVHDAGVVERVALVVALDGGDPSRIYERVRRTLLETYGAPTFTFEEGAWGPGYATDLASGRFIRVAEWATPGGVLRLGIPRRLDGLARIEIHHVRSSRSPRDTGWGLLR